MSDGDDNVPSLNAPTLFDGGGGHRLLLYLTLHKSRTYSLRAPPSVYFEFAPTITIIITNDNPPKYLDHLSMARVCVCVGGHKVSHSSQCT